MALERLIGTSGLVYDEQRRMREHLQPLLRFSRLLGPPQLASQPPELADIHPPLTIGAPTFVLPFILPRDAPWRFALGSITSTTTAA